MTMSQPLTDVRILVVDDSPEIRRLIEVLIDRRGGGWQVVGHASDGEEGIELARAEQPDLVLLDISMPAMDGIEALPLVHRAAPDALVVMLTGFPHEAVRDRVTAAGADGLLDKDDLFRGLVPELEAILARPQGQRPTAAAPG